MAHVFGYITTKDKDQAVHIGQMLVEKRLVACANILPQMESIYHWEGKVQTAKESVLIVKTLSKFKGKIQTIVKALHSYSNPCVVFIDLKGGSPEFLKWISKNVGAP